MDFDEAVKKYGPIEDGKWPGQVEFCSLMLVPEDIAATWINAITGRPVGKIYCNKDMQDALLRAIQNVRDRGLISELKTFHGCYEIRDIRGKPGHPSAHCYALAIDINADTNQLGTEGDIHPDLVRCFTDEKFVWGGTFHRKDPMHFSFGW